MFLHNVELTEYQKSLISKSSGKWWLSKAVLMTAAVDALALLCCYALVFCATNPLTNWAGFALVLYVVLEVAATLGFALAIVMIKVASFITQKAKIEFNDQSLELDEKYNKIFGGMYKLIPLGRSWAYYLFDIGTDILIFASFVTAGWFITAIIHGLCVLVQFKLKHKMYAQLLAHLKTRMPEGGEKESVDELMDKLCNG